jgi:hypothetical protein
MRTSRRAAKMRAPALLDEMRASLSPGQYIMLLHLAATTGQMPILSPDGRPTGEFSQLDTQQRIETAKYLINKIVPDAPRIELSGDLDPQRVEIQDLEAMPTAELLRIADPAYEPAPHPADAP